MRKFIPVGLIAGGLLTASHVFGYAQPPNRHVELETRVANLEARVTNLEAQLKSRESSTVQGRPETPVPPRKIETVPETPVPSRRPNPERPASTVPGVPSDVMARIRAAAKESFPDNYHMQRFFIDQQIKAYKEMNPEN